MLGQSRVHLWHPDLGGRNIPGHCFLSAPASRPGPALCAWVLRSQVAPQAWKDPTPHTVVTTILQKAGWQIKERSQPSVYQCGKSSGTYFNRKIQVIGQYVKYDSIYKQQIIL